MIASVLNRLVGSLLSRPLASPSAQERESLDELRAAFDGFPVIDTTNVLETEAAWFGYMNRVRERVLSNDPRKFLRWDLILETMFISYAPYISKELAYLKQRSDWATRWREAIRESPVGQPLPYMLYPGASGSTIHHAYHLATFEEKTGERVENLDYVVEFGAGYGGMCRVLFNLGFRGKYICFDLPPFAAIQRYYLKTVGLPVVAAGELDEAPGVICVSEVSKLEEILKGVGNGKRAMFMAMWSLSESPVAIRDSILPLVSGFQSFLIAYYDRFGEVDNTDFFREWQARNTQLRWQSWPIAHIPRNTYLVGQRSENAPQSIT